MPLTPEEKDRAHCLIYDMFIHDNQVIRSFAAQDLKALLGITGPVPAHHLERRRTQPSEKPEDHRPNYK